MARTTWLTGLLVAVLLACPAGGQGGKELTPEMARKLLPKAAGMSVAEFQKLAGGTPPAKMKNQPLTLTILTLKVAGKDAEKEFRFLGDAIKPAELTEAIQRTKADGYGTIIHPDDITSCTCKTKGDRADGVVAFANKVYAGQVEFTARRTRGGWAITEFRMPKSKMRVVLTRAGTWKKEALGGK